jgi:hypothetical protein
LNETPLDTEHENSIHKCLMLRKSADRTPTLRVPNACLDMARRIEFLTRDLRPSMRLDIVTRFVPTEITGTQWHLGARDSAYLAYRQSICERS